MQLLLFSEVQEKDSYLHGLWRNKVLQDTKNKKLDIFCQMLHNRDMEASGLIKVVKY